MEFTLGEFNYYSHIIIGSIAFLGGIISLSTKKGSKIHKTAGKVFIVGMLYSILNVIIFMTEEFLPLAILMSVGTFYFMIIAISAINHTKKWSIVIDRIFIIFPFVIMMFTSIQFIRVLSIPEVSLLGAITRLLFALTFGFALVRHFKLLRKRPTEPMYYIKRHAFGMILAFGFATMAVLRIGIKIDFLSLELSTLLPLVLALLTTFYAERNIHKFFP